MKQVGYVHPLFAFSAIFAVAATASMGAPPPAFAQSGPEATTPPPEGKIIYARDVPYGSAIGPRTPAREHTVTTGPTELILSSMTAGLEPIGDDENAAVIANTNAQTAQVGDQIALGTSALSSMAGSGNSAASVGDIQSSAVGGAVGQATGAIGNAMGTLRSVLGGLNAGPGGGPGGGQ